MSRGHHLSVNVHRTFDESIPCHAKPCSSSRTSYSSESDLPGESGTWNMILDLSLHFDVCGTLGLERGLDNFMDVPGSEPDIHTSVSGN